MKQGFKFHVLDFGVELKFIFEIFCVSPSSQLLIVTYRLNVKSDVFSVSTTSVTK